MRLSISTGRRPSLHHQTRGHGAIDAHAAGNQILHASLLRAKQILASSADRFRSGHDGCRFHLYYYRAIQCKAWRQISRAHFG